MTKKYIICPVCTVKCEVKKDGTGYFGFSTKEIVTHAKTTKLLTVCCESCGAHAYSVSDFKNGYISNFIKEDCDNCRFAPSNSIASCCPYHNNNVGTDCECLEEDCCHYPCGCLCDAFNEEFDTDFCTKKSRSHEDVVQTLLVNILRELTWARKEREE